MNASELAQKICITLPLAYSLFNPASKGPFGGWEVRITLIARELAKRGHLDVNIVVGDLGQPHVEIFDGVRLISWVGRDVWGIPARKESNPFPENSMSFGIWDRIQKRIRTEVSHYFPGPTFGHIGNYRITPKMIGVYDEVDADIYIVPGNTPYSAEVAYYCSQRSKRYVFLSGSDMDYYPDFKTNPNGSDIYGTPHFLKRYSIEKADAHIVQNERQAEMLHEGYGRTSTVIKNPIDVEQKFPRNPNSYTILWVGKSDERVKRPSVVFEVARRLPEYQFVVIMNMASPKTHMEYTHKAKQFQNVKLIDRVPFDQIESFFADARLHLNTSTFEGFPNTYLQAAKYGVPTVTTGIDPGYMLSRHGCGLISGEEVDSLVSDISKLMNDDKLYAELSRKSLQYVRAYHDKDDVIRKYEEILNAVTERGRIE